MEKTKKTKKTIMNIIVFMGDTGRDNQCLFFVA